MWTRTAVSGNHQLSRLLKRLDRFSIRLFGDGGEIGKNVGYPGIGNLHRRVSRHLVARGAQLREQRRIAKRRRVEPRPIAQRALPHNPMTTIATEFPEIGQTRFGIAFGHVLGLSGVGHENGQRRDPHTCSHGFRYSHQRPSDTMSMSAGSPLFTTSMPRLIAAAKSLGSETGPCA